MRTIETTAVVTPDHTITVKVPEDIPPGDVRVVVVVNHERPEAPLDWAAWPAHNFQLRDPNCRFRREEIYGDDGR